LKVHNNLYDMSGRHVLITGGAGYLGRAIANTLAKLGADITLLDHHLANLDAIKNELINNWGVDCQAITCDLESEHERSEAIERIKSDNRGLSCLINNAAFVGTTGLEGWSTSFEKQSLDTWRRAIEVNLTAPFHFSQAMAPLLRTASGGNIINITSIYGELAPDWRLYSDTTMGNPAAYSISKGGLTQLTRWLSTTLSPEVRVNAIAPGGIYRGQPDKFVQRYINRTPLKRMAEEDDFCGAVAFLSSDLSAYVTGQIITIDGGYSSW